VDAPCTPAPWRRRTGGLGVLACLALAVLTATPVHGQDTTPEADDPVRPVPPDEQNRVPEPEPGTDADTHTAPPDATSGTAVALDVAPTDAAVTAPGGKIVYVLERIEIAGNRTRDGIIARFVPLQPGDLLDVDDPAIERIQWRLMGTGWFDEVQLRLVRGSQRGRVVLVIEVKERNTLVISRVVAGLARVVTSSTDTDDTLRPYGGIGLTESNLLGLGIGVGASAVVSEHQQGFELRYGDPMRLGAGFDLSGRLFYNNARDFFGREPLVAVDCPPGEPDEEPDIDACIRKRAVVVYDRFGFGVGTGHEITAALRYELDWLGEIVGVRSKPRAASTLRGEHGEERVPIDFHIDDATSYVSSLHVGLIFDRRDDPALPSRGQALRVDARMGSKLLGSTYDFARLEATFRHFQPLPWRHGISLGAFLGTVFGRAPFFYRFYAADLSDLLPSRALELNLDHRRTHNLLGTSIQEFDKADLAARIDFEYQLPLLRKGGGDIRGIDAYAGAGLFFLADRNALRVSLPGYEGFERLPVDLTFDIGVQADTRYGVFKIGFSSLIGFLPDLGRDTP
jgi:outer membrane protein insertion porin family